MAKPEFDIVVIGGGSAGLVVAAGGAQLGARVALVEKHRMGGDCLNTGCVPSKALLRSAKIAQLMRTADRYALPATEPKVDLARVMERVAAVIARIEPNDSPERFRGLGVDVIHGAGRFVDGETFEVADRRLTAKHFVLATGSRAALPPIPGLARVPHLTNETLFDLREDVPSLVVIGAGPIGVEMAQAFCRLGTRVTVLDAGPGLLPREDRDLAAVIESRLRAEGVALHFDVAIERVEQIDRAQRAGSADPVGNAQRADSAEPAEATDAAALPGLRVTGARRGGEPLVVEATHLLVAAGRRPNVEGLDLERAGVAVREGRLVVDERLRTTNPRIFAAGDVAGSYQFTHVAGHHAGIVLRQAIFRLFWSRPSPVVPWCTYTDPELARVGLSEAEAVQRSVLHRVYRFPFAELDRAQADGETDGFAKVITDPKGRILGAAIAGAHAGELIHEYVLAIGRRMKAADVANAIHVYPTLAEINKRVADQRLKERLTPRSRTWIKRIFGLQGT